MTPVALIVFACLIISCAGLPMTRKNKQQSTSYPFTFISRETWGGRDPLFEPTPIGHPVSLVVIHHTYQPGVCITQPECKRAMRSMQDFHQLTHGWSDIGYNFAVGGEGSVYEGRGWDVVGAHAVGVNSRSVGIALIGDFRTTVPSLTQRQAAQKLIEAGIELGYIDPGYQVAGHRQVGATECPGDALFHEIATWENFKRED